MNAAVAEIKPEKSSGLSAISTHDLCDTSAVLNQLNLGMVRLFAPGSPEMWSNVHNSQYTRMANSWFFFHFLASNN